MLQGALTWLEERVRERAPELAPDVRRVSAMASQASITTALLGESAALEAVPGASSASDEGGGAPRVRTAGFARYADLGLIGRGGMGEVRRVRDLELNRVVAMKQVRTAAVSTAALARFVEEVQTTAQLQHPGIVPVYDSGRTADGAVYFTMKEVRGRELSEVIQAVHEASAER